MRAPLQVEKRDFSQRTSIFSHFLVRVSTSSERLFADENLSIA
jgi:hypothetical protein